MPEVPNFKQYVRRLAGSINEGGSGANSTDIQAMSDPAGYGVPKFYTYSSDGLSLTEFTEKYSADLVTELQRRMALPDYDGDQLWAMSEALETVVMSDDPKIHINLLVKYLVGRIEALEGALGPQA